MARPRRRTHPTPSLDAAASATRPSHRSERVQPPPPLRRPPRSPVLLLSLALLLAMPAGGMWLMTTGNTAGAVQATAPDLGRVW